MFEKLNRIIERSSDIAIICHISPDGDTLGAALALKHALSENRKNVNVYSVSVPKMYAFMPGIGGVKTEPPETAPDLAIAADVSDLGRMGLFLPVFKGCGATVCIDHHATNFGFADENVIKAGASSTCEIVYDFLVSRDTDITKEIAENLFVGMSTDTKHFVFSSTAPSTFRAAAALLETGIDINEIARRLYFLRSAARTRLLGAVLSGMELHLGGRFALLTCPASLKDACGAGYDDLEGVINYAIETENVEIACMLRDSDESAVKGSVRITAPHDAAAFAARFGGGGHSAAAGFTVTDTNINAVREMVVRAAAEILK